MSQGHDPQAPRKPFNARGSLVKRCEQCRMPGLHCICAYRLQVATRAQFWLITHRIEHYKPTNTGRLIGDCIMDTRVFEWSRTEPDPTLLAALADPRFAPCLVFPDDQEDYRHRVVDVTRACDTSRIPVFILLDGTWRQARRMFRRSDYLAELPIVALRTERLTRYRLRKAASPEHLCTAEVAAELLHQAGDEEGAQVLDDYFTVFNEQYAAARRDAGTPHESGAAQRLLEKRRAHAS
ncbi:tRNA-uridine aminocarboxypropyltransferase [Kushneria indalinina]|uniref:tRNA-uridine aminocarboxypropyltransferase n=1 Tax=Kushneria indalinina DSM 14324 TaxID=1122140 RepID=A0A3D9DS54_9GAMM|nr:DTW domain-containing protein [Kushneria indalinina]REC93536.1 hypothetical protein C8D72_3269 [Kushneria indalinina DSM 14324]